MKYNTQHMNCTDVIPIQYLYLMAWCMSRYQIKYINGEWSTLRSYQTCRRQATNKTRKEGLKSYAHMTIYTISQARLKLTMCRYKLPTTSVISLTFSNFWYLALSSVAKMHAACSRSPAVSCIYLISFESIGGLCWNLVCQFTQRWVQKLHV